MSDTPAADARDGAWLRLSDEAQRREPHALRSLVPLLADPDCVWLAGGTPHPSTFPFTSLAVTLQDGTPVALSPAELEDAQQYCMSDDRGYKPLVEYLSTHVTALHGPPHPCHVAITCGNTSALDCVLRCTCEPGDIVLVEEYCYAPALQLCAALGLVVHQVACDTQGPCTAALQKLLDTHGAAVKAFYCVPVSANPTGVTWSQARKQEVYTLAAQRDVLLIEDDAYFYLQFNTAAPTDATQQPGLTRLGKSLLSYDTKGGAVVRLDTASKMVAPGLRVGWISTCHAGLHACLVRTMQGSVQGSSSLSQVLLHSLLRQWHPTNGLHAHLQRLQVAYAARCVALCAAADKHLGPTRAAWHKPSAGMFLWLRLTYESSHASGQADTETELQHLLGQYAVAAVPGARFSATPVRSPFLRLSFASASDSQFDTGMQRLAKLLDHAAGEARKGKAC